jgi:hypothetical protein
MGGFDPLCIPTESERLSKNEKIFTDISVQLKKAGGRGVEGRLRSTIERTGLPSLLRSSGNLTASDYECTPVCYDHQTTTSAKYYFRMMGPWEQWNT